MEILTCTIMNLAKYWFLNQTFQKQNCRGTKDPDS